MADEILTRRNGAIVEKDRKFNPALFARLADDDGLALIQHSRALRREACCACARPIGNAGYAKMARILKGVGRLRGVTSGTAW